MRCSIIHVAAAFVMLSAPADAASITFNTDPFEGSTAPTTPGRQVVGNEVFTTFDIATDVFTFDASVFGVSSISFANNVIGNIPTSGVNTIVLRTFDNDNDPTTPFAAGNAANLIAGQVTSATPGFFIYFNQGLDLPRLVFSPDLNDNTSDLKVLARFTNLGGQPGRDALSSITAGNFAIAQVVPEPSSLSLLLAAGGFLAGCSRLRRPRN
jgi:PEP-CTERM motif-containing protein